jgi:hypothetical protein
MRTLARNKRKFYYASFVTNTEMFDDEGNLTGENSVVYGKPTEMLGNISSAHGEVVSQQFGESENYDKVIVLDDIDTPIDEYAILWVDTLPLLDDDGNTITPHDYIVKRVAKSLNSVSIAIQKVKVNG